MIIARAKAGYAVAFAAAWALAACGSSGSGGGSPLPSISSSTGSTAAPSSASSSATPSAASTATVTGPNGCPSTSAVSTAAGTTVSDPHVTTQSATTLCSYPDSNGIIAISDYRGAGYDAGTVKTALQTQLQALGGTDAVQTVSGIGDAAFEFTHAGSTTLGVISDSSYVAVIGAPSPSAALAIAKLVVS